MFYRSWLWFCNAVRCQNLGPFLVVDSGNVYVFPGLGFCVLFLWSPCACSLSVVCVTWAPSLMRGWVCHSCAAGPCKRSQGTHDHILLSQIWDFPFRRLSHGGGIQPCLHSGYWLNLKQIFVTWAPHDTYVKYGSARKCQWKFWRKFHDVQVPSRQTIHNLVNKLRTTGLLRNKKQKHKCWVLIGEKLDD
jgi:hypothetical protein